MAQNRPGPPPGRGSGRIPVLSTTLRREGLRSGGPPEPATEVRPPRMIIRVPPRPANGETPAVPNPDGPANRENSVVPNTARNEIRPREAAPPSYTEQVEQEATGAPGIGRVSADEDPLSEPSTETQGNQELGGDSTSSVEAAMGGNTQRGSGEGTATEGTTVCDDSGKRGDVAIEYRSSG